MPLPGPHRSGWRWSARLCQPTQIVMIIQYPLFTLSYLCHDSTAILDIALHELVVCPILQPRSPDRPQLVESTCSSTWQAESRLEQAICEKARTLYLSRYMLQSWTTESATPDCILKTSQLLHVPSAVLYLSDFRGSNNNNAPSPRKRAQRKRTNSAEAEKHGICGTSCMRTRTQTRHTCSRISRRKPRKAFTWRRGQ